MVYSTDQPTAPAAVSPISSPLAPPMFPPAVPQVPSPGLNNRYQRFQQFQIDFKRQGISKKYQNLCAISAFPRIMPSIFR
jgi:hypothetical protein